METQAKIPTVYKFHCRSCGAPVAVQQNKLSLYNCPFCETRHHISTEDSKAELESLSYKEIIALQLSLGKRQIKGTLNADMNEVMDATVIQQRVMKLMLRYNGKSAEQIDSIDKMLKEQRAEQIRRLTEKEFIESNLIYNFNCAACGSPINHKPKNDYEEILCPTCGAKVKFNKNKAKSNDGTQIADSQEDKGNRLIELGEKIRAAFSRGDLKLYKKLNDEYAELSMSYATNFNYSNHKDIFSNIAETNRAGLTSAHSQMEVWEMKSKKTDEFEKLSQKIEQEINSLEEEMEEISDKYDDKDDPELLKKLKPFEDKIQNLNQTLDLHQAELDKLEQDFEDAKYKDLSAKDKVKMIIDEISKLDPDDYSEIEEYEEDKKRLESKKQKIISDLGLSQSELSSLLGKVDKEIEQKKLLESEYDMQAAADNKAIINAAIANDFESFRKIFNTPNNNAYIHTTTEDGEYLINIFVRHGNWEAVSFILKYVAGENNRIDPDARDHENKKRTILFTTLENAQKEIAVKLIKLGADCSFTDEDDNTPLHFVVEKNDVEIVKLILSKNIEIDNQNNAGLTPLHLAVKANNFEIVNLLVKKVGDYEIGDNEDNTALHYAAKNQNLEIIKVLLKAGADVNCVNENSDTPLHFAVSKENIAIIEFLLKNGADTDIQNNNFLTPLTMAERSNKTEITKLFQ